MPKEVKSYRIPPYLIEFIKEYKASRKIEHSTDVLIYALRRLKMDFDEEKKKGFQKVDLKFTETEEWLNMKPKDKVLRKLEHDPHFKKNEYEIVKNLSPEQVDEYVEKHQDSGMSLQEYYDTYIKK